MKHFNRLLLVAVMAILSIGVANAEFRFGVRAGMNINSLKADKASALFDKDNACGWNAGVYCDFTVPLIGIGADASVLYSRMNNGVDDDFTTIDASNLTTENTTVFGRNFIEIPINVKYKVTVPAIAAIVKPYIFTGPSFAFKLDKNTFESIKTKTCQVAWNVGIGVELLKHLQVQGSYGFGINNIADFTGMANAADLKVKNNYWTIGVGYLF